MFFGLRLYQQQAVQFIHETPKGCLWLPMRLGKSLITLAAIHDRKDDFLPALIVGPKRVVRHVWKEEIEKWGFDFSVSIVDGTPAQKRRAAAKELQITCVSADSLKYVEDHYYKTVVFDESTMFKSPKAARRKIAKRIAMSCERVIELTGSPTSGAGLIDVWGQFDLCFGKADCPLGTYWQFGRRFFSFDHFNRPHPKKGSEERVAGVMRDWVFRRDLSEITMPGLHTNDLVVDMTSKQIEALSEAELEENGTFVAHRTISSGFRYEHHWSGDTNTVWLGDPKLDALREIRGETEDSILVLCNFKAEVDVIARDFEAAILDGRTSARDAATIIDAWCSGSLPMLVANCAAMSHGLNLQSGGRRIVWYSLPVSQEIYDQAVARLWRSGQKDAVFVHRILAADSIDQQIARLLDRKALSQQALMAAVGA
jgi:SNF2 family DNA or RNA helicase